MGVKISELTQAMAAQDTDVLPIVQNGETKKITKENLFSNTETEIENLEGSKVNKTGDTLTGELNFNNKNDYAVFRKTRTINGVDYNANFGIGANQAARIEFQDANQSNLGSLEIRSDGRIWNGKTGNRLIETKSKINYENWHSVVLTRSDDNYLYIMLYGSNLLKEGNYSIANDFRILTYGTTAGTLTIPISAINAISRKDWGFEVVVNRSGITGITSGQYNGIAIPGGATLTLLAT